jgi:RNA-directed DNA polymerase
MGFNYFKPKIPPRPTYKYEPVPQLPLINNLDTSWKFLEENNILTRDTLIRSLERNIAIYDEIQITKRDGSVRHISVPNKELKVFQFKILRSFLDEPETYHSAAFAYIKGKSAVQCARVHENAQWLVKIDIQDFFHHIDERMIYWSFLERGVKPYSSFLLARLLTRVAYDWQEITKELPRKYKRNRRHSLTKKYDVYGKRLGFLPQGSPTSGAISNLVSFDLDNRLSAVAAANSLIYTRYADDIIFSSESEFDRSLAERALKEAQAVIRKKGFKVNEGKTRIIPPGARKKILGVLVGDGGLRLPRDTKQRIDGDLRAIAKFGFKKHAKKTKLKNELALLNKVFGQLVWAHEVNSAWAEPRMELLSNMANSQLQDVFQKLNQV